MPQISNARPSLEILYKRLRTSSYRLDFGGVGGRPPGSKPHPPPPPPRRAWGPYDPTTATSMKTSLKNRFRILSTSSRLSQVAWLLKRREFMFELKRGGHTRVQTETVEFIALLFLSLKTLKFGRCTS